MNTVNEPGAAKPTLLTPRNLIFLVIALATIGAGYAVLSADQPALAAVLLVFGYVVLFPIALIL